MKIQFGQFPRRIAGLRAIVSLGLLALTIASATAYATPEKTASPRLVVIVVVDQFRYHDLVKFADYYGDGGFKRMLDNGANFTRARYRHGTTDTCPGHAVIATGTWGNANGIVSNSWFDERQNKKIACASAKGAAASQLLLPTIGDVLKEASGGASKVVSVAGKQSAAVMLGGHRADAAYWPDSHGRFTQARIKKQALPVWVERFNDSGAADSYFGTVWEPLPVVKQLTASIPEDEPAVNRDVVLSSSFPHPLAGPATEIGRDYYSALQRSPFGNELLAEFAMAAIREEGLGQDKATDILAVGFSANDRVGHRYGPDSLESVDMVLRTDRLLARFFGFLDDHVGLDRTLIVLTSDHGVAPLPEVTNVRAPANGAGRISRKGLQEIVNQALVEEFGHSDAGEWVAFHDFPNIYLNEKAIVDEGVSLEEAAKLAKTALQNTAGIRAAYTQGELEQYRHAAKVPRSVRPVLLSYFPGRSGHVVYQAMPYYVANETGTNHGSHWSYDSHVPMMWLGPNIEKGAYRSNASPADIAPTLMTLLGVGNPSLVDGKLLREMLVAP